MPQQALNVVRVILDFQLIPSLKTLVSIISSMYQLYESMSLKLDTAVAKLGILFSLQVQARLLVALLFQFLDFLNA